MMLNKKITHSNQESVDPSFSDWMSPMLEEDNSNFIGKMLAIPGENEELVEDVVADFTSPRVRKQFNALMYGFKEVIPLKLIYIFDERELEVLIYGGHSIDVGDWMRFTDYRGYKKDDEVIQWFWQEIQRWPNTMRSDLLEFATGTPRIPINGFRDLRGSDGPRRFTIEKSGDPRAPPTSQVSKNKIKLPPYKNHATLSVKLMLVLALRSPE
ncbi:hypothetical protein BS47DRAFT_1117981 [Hydnum rufescens UP504]|uniref:HECT-type E3 ubiquitin transferase n=1 Tax=Hydnum rufescens UP504 TaxID=1448309 RepID=A0A9P6AA20_9AGAM|nr:hypothetical protein BS47DRAFT_1117981 [Hydnum rufescens UP504]